MNRAAFTVPVMADHFERFGAWLAVAVGDNKAAITVNRYLSFFLEIEKVWQAIPKYNRLVDHFGAEGLRRVRLPMRWMQEAGMVVKDAAVQAEDSEKRQIAGMLKALEGDPAGSGSIHAMVCWNANKDARMAVESAKRSDIFSGGTVRFICANTGEKDIEDVCSADHLNKHVIPMEGLVMYKVPSGKTTVGPMPVGEASMNDPEVKQAIDRLVSGATALSAPCDGMYNKWTSAETEAFRSALQQMIDNP